VQIAASQELARLAQTPLVDRKAMLARSLKRASGIHRPSMTTATHADGRRCLGKTVERLPLRPQQRLYQDPEQTRGRLSPRPGRPRRVEPLVTQATLARWL
jgi:hypothetical protein